MDKSPAFYIFYVRLLIFSEIYFLFYFSNRTEILASKYRSAKSNKGKVLIVLNVQC